MIQQIVIDGRYLVQVAGGALLVHEGCIVGSHFASKPECVTVMMIGPERAAGLYPLCQHEAEVREIIEPLVWAVRID